MNKPLPRDPMIRELVQMAQRSQLSRRHMLQGAGIGATALALAACAPTGSNSLKPAIDTSATNKDLIWSNWPTYIDEDAAGNHPTLANFTQRTGITVLYKPEIEENNAYFAHIKDRLAAGRAVDADTFCLTDWMVARLIRFGYLQELDAANIPNKKWLAPALLNPDYDPGRLRSIPWQNGFSGIAWNTEQVPAGVQGIEDLWKPEFKGKVSVLGEMRDTMGLILMSQGVDISKNGWGNAEFSAAIAVLETQLKNGQVIGVMGNEYLGALFSGVTHAAFAFSGDITALNQKAGYEKFKFALPLSGATLWGDAFVVPMGSARKSNVEQLINYYYDPNVATEVAASVNFITPVTGARDVALGAYPELAQNELIFPTAETLAKAHIFRTLTATEDQSFNSDFQRIQKHA